MNRKNHKLSWSNTRITLLEYCEKKYFLNYYSEALRGEFPELWKKNQILKRCKSLEMWVGEKTHYLISDYLFLLQDHSCSSIEIEDLINKMQDEMKREFLISKNKDFSHLNYTEWGGLSEHYYGENIDAYLSIAIDKVVNNLRAFIRWGGNLIDKMKSGKAVYIETPRTPNFEKMKIDTSCIEELSDINIMANPDFGLVMGDKSFYILDWKTGKEPDCSLGISDQLKVYALRLLLNVSGSHYLKDFEIYAYELYLPGLKFLGGKVNEQDIQEIIEKIDKDIDFQKTFLVDQDPLLNKSIDVNLFSRTPYVQRCESCTFRQVCEELKILKK